MTRLATPEGLLSPDLVADFPADRVPSADGRRTYPVGSMGHALELARLVIRSGQIADAAARTLWAWSTSRNAAARSSAELCFLQAQAQVATWLPVVADLFDSLGLDARWQVANGVDVMVEYREDGSVVTVRDTNRWRSYADGLRRAVLADMRRVTEGAPPPMGLAPAVWVAVALVGLIGTGFVAYLVSMRVGEAMELTRREQGMLEERLRRLDELRDRCAAGDTAACAEAASVQKTVDAMIAKPTPIGELTSTARWFAIGVGLFALSRVIGSR